MKLSNAECARLLATGKGFGGCSTAGWVLFAIGLGLGVELERLGIDEITPRRDGLGILA
jgi:hypothetical protein